MKPAEIVPLISAMKTICFDSIEIFTKFFVMSYDLC